MTVEWTDDRWAEVWERTLDPVERHEVARAVRRREPPDDPYHRRVGLELARRWRRAARNQALFHGLWIAFWVAVARSADPEAREVLWFAISMVALSSLAIAGCVAIHRYLSPVASRWTAQQD